MFQHPTTRSHESVLLLRASFDFQLKGARATPTLRSDQNQEPKKPEPGTPTQF